MLVIGIVFIVLASVFFITCNLLCCLCAGRGGGRSKKSPDVEKGMKKTITSTGSRATRDGNMVVLAGAGGAVVGTAIANGVMTSNDKRDRDNKGGNSNISGGCGVVVGGDGGGGMDNSDTNHGCCCGGGGGDGGGCGGGCGGCGG
ncbi:chorion class high-cysteine HCB protein 13-like [Solanum tuberosum]|uniref:Histidine-rich glycoprotein n=1 Tax=Solanum tuberosum TaxID=4113 RepID=M1AD83_SOLTU|nr:PREDICTED: chorion class high-cysteine HCB protein 13-like [Solanum tuberosum]